MVVATNDQERLSACIQSKIPEKGTEIAVKLTVQQAKLQKEKSTGDHVLKMESVRNPPAEDGVFPQRSPTMAQICAG